MSQRDEGRPLEGVGVGAGAAIDAPASEASELKVGSSWSQRAHCPRHCMPTFSACCRGDGGFSPCPSQSSPHPGLNLTSHLGGLVPSIHKGSAFSRRGQLPTPTFCKHGEVCSCGLVARSLKVKPDHHLPPVADSKRPCVRAEARSRSSKQ